MQSNSMEWNETEFQKRSRIKWKGVKRNGMELGAVELNETAWKEWASFN